jgi:PKD repeat protein
MMLFLGGYAWALEDPADAGAIQQGITSLVSNLETAKDAGLASPDELIVLAYQLAKDRVPTPAEFFVTRAIRDKNSLSAGQVLALVVQGGMESMWDDCRAFLGKATLDSFRSTPESAALAATLAATPLKDVITEINAPVAVLKAAGEQVEKALPEPKAGVEYNIYFGDLHNHSTLSDGSSSETEAYAYARDVAKMDFFSLSDHAENMSWNWPWSNNYDKLVTAANQFNAPGTFATLYGFEYGNPFMGHISVWNTTDYTGAVANPTTGLFYSWLEDHPAAFATYNHPGSYDEFNAEFSHFDLTSSVVPQMVGVEMHNHGDPFSVYYYVKAYGSDKSFIDVAIEKGWYLGAGGGLDTHSTDFGGSCPFRTAVLATAKTREAIIDAYKNRRFYSTEDKDLYVDFRCAGYPMGSKVTGLPRLFTVSTHDASGDILKEVRLYRNGVQYQTKPLSGSSAQVDFLDTAPNAKDYYYVIVALTTGNYGGHPAEAISSPIWCAGNADIQPAAAFSGTPTSGIAPLTVQFTDLSSPGTKPITAWTWDFGDSTTSAAPSPIHTYTAGGVYTVALKVTTAAGESTESKAGYISVDNSIPPSGTIVINGNRSATNSTQVTLSLTWTPGNGGNVVRMRFSDDGAHWSAWEPLAAARPYTLPSGDGHKTVRVQFLDKANVRSGIASDYIRLDTTAPTGSIIINDGALTTKTQSVTLGLSWSDGTGSQVSRMRFSDDGAHWSAWETPKATRAYTLPAGLGYHTVRVQYLDGAGNYSAAYNDYIKLLAP